MSKNYSIDIEPIIARYQRYWNLSKEDAEALAWGGHVEIQDNNGEYMFTFRTFGKDGERAPDVLALQTRVKAAGA